GRLDQVIVAGVGTIEGVTAEGYDFSGTDVLVGEHCLAGTAQSHAVLAQGGDRRGATQRGSGRRVVDFAADRQAVDEKVGTADGGSHVGRLNQCVVAGIGATQGVAAHGDELIRADVFVGEYARSSADDRNMVGAQWADRRG